MPNYYSSSHIIKILEKQGFLFVSQKGSHIKYRKISLRNTLTVIIPHPRKEIPYGTFRSIVKQSGVELFLFLK